MFSDDFRAIKLKYWKKVGQIDKILTTIFIEFFINPLRLQNWQHAICLIGHGHPFALAHFKQLLGSRKSSGMWFPLIIRGIKY